MSHHHACCMASVEEFAGSLDEESLKGIASSCVLTPLQLTYLLKVVRLGVDMEKRPNDCFCPEVRELQARIKELEGGIVLRGWRCASCQSFNGSEKEELRRCRSCDAERLV